MSVNDVQIVDPSGKHLASVDGVPVDAVVQKWRSDFNSAAAMATKWDTVAGAGGVAPAVAAGVVTFGTGVTNGSETILTSKAIFRIPVRFAIGFALSQRIANQEFRLEFISVDPVTGLPYPPGDANYHAIAWYFGGADTITQGRVERTSGGITLLDAGPVTITTLLAPVAQIMELVADNDAVRAYQRPVNNAAAARTASIRRDDNLPDPNAYYKLRIRGKNTGVPGSNTTVTVSFAAVMDYNELVAEVSSGQGQSDAGSAVPVAVANSPTVGVANTTIAAPSTSATTTPALTPQKVLSAATTNATLIKATVGKVVAWDLGNNGAGWAYLKFFNKATAPVPGTDIPVMTVPIPPGGSSVFPTPVGEQFATGIGYSITGAPTDTDTTAVAVNQVVGFIGYV